jgi:hypothetical protein
VSLPAADCTCYVDTDVQVRIFLTFAIALSLPLLADDRSKQTLSAAHTERFPAPTAGTIRLENSFGEVDIDGWDRPEVEVTVTRSAEHTYDPAQRAQAQKRLDEVRITARQDGDTVIITTSYPPRNVFFHPLSRRSDIEIAYSIKAPRTSKIVVDQNRGGLNVYDILGDIHATVINGQITLTLPAAAQYAIDAQAKVGAVYSDFEGRGRSRRVLGEEFDRQSSTPSTNLFLRVRLGDIIIQKLRGPDPIAAPASALLTQPRTQ